MQRDAPLNAPKSHDRPPSSRSIVIARLAVQAARFPRLSLEPPSFDALSPRDASFANALYTSVISRWLTLRAVVESQLDRPFRHVEPPVQAALLVGTAQLLLLSVPDHAAIHESVEWAKREVRRGAGGLVNAVLRRIADLREGTQPEWSGSRSELPLNSGGSLALSDPIFPDDELERLAVCTSHPLPLIERWHEAFGFEEARRLAWHDVLAPPVILNASHAAQPVEGATVHAHTDPGFLVFDGPQTALREMLAARDDVWVQDPASARPVGLITGEPRVIVDVCAGRGTKTRQLARRFPAAEIIASETDPARASALRSVFSRGGRVRVVAPSDLPEVAGKRVDLLVLDVPCSNTGVLARRAEARYRFSMKELDRLLRLQRGIVEQHMPLLNQDGSILYATCSLEREENEEQADWIARRHGLSVAAVERTMPASTPGDSPAQYRDGSFAALLVR